MSYPFTPPGVPAGRVPGRKPWALQRTEQEWDELNAHEAENRRLKKIPGHQPMLVEQHRHIHGGEDLDFKVWVSCTCLRWMDSRWFLTVDAALVAHERHKGGK